MSLAAKLPYDHAYAGGYPGIGSQALPTDSDCLTYLAAVKAADGAGVEVGVAMAVDSFVKGCKADGTWSALKAACVLCGARTISGALVPLAGAAPTAYSFASGDYSRTTGLKGDGSTKYIDSGRADDADGQDDKHLAVYATALAVDNGTNVMCYAGAYAIASSSVLYTNSTQPAGTLRTRLNSQPLDNSAALHVAGFLGAVRSSASGYSVRGNETTQAILRSSTTPTSANAYVFALNDSTLPAAANYANARLAFYSIGASLDLAALDARVSTLVTAIGAAI